MVLLVVRVLGSFGAALILSSGYALSMGFVYLLAFIGVLKSQKWGPIIAICIAVFDIGKASTGVLGVAGGLGAIVMDLCLLGLGYLNLKEVSS